jgi:hypothetical protein
LLGIIWTTAALHMASSPPRWRHHGLRNLCGRNALGSSSAREAVLLHCQNAHFLRYRVYVHRTISNRQSRASGARHLYTLNKQGQIFGPADLIEADTDESAIEKAKRLRSSLDQELWQDDRIVITLKVDTS